MSQYTSRKVFQHLADLLPAGSPTSFDITRFSVELDEAGIAQMRNVHLSLYAPRSAELQRIQRFPEAAWDPQQPDVGAQYGIVWLTLADLHHNGRGKDRLIAVVLVGQILFAGMTLSSTLRHIQREDGEDENGALVFMQAVISHYRSLEQIRFAEDVTRAGREDFGWSSLKRKCQDRDVAIVLESRRYDLKNEADATTLKALGIASTNEDPTRRRKLTGKRLSQYAAGGAALSEDQLPIGWKYQRDVHGRPVRAGGRRRATAAGRCLGHRRHPGPVPAGRLGGAMVRAQRPRARPRG